jgi:thymidylate synthase ThyX
MPLDEAFRATIAPYVSSPDDDVYALVGLPEEVVAVLYAYATRTGEDLRASLGRLLHDRFLDVGLGAGRGPSMTLAPERANAFHARWVAIHGHGSIAEHAVVHLVAENVSLLAARALTDHRLGAFAEKNTRYVAIERARYVDLPELGGDAAAYRAAVEKLLGTYEQLFPRVYAALGARLPRAEGMGDAEHAERVRVATCDLLRGLVPAGAKTSVGMTVNARALETLLTKLLSSPLAEVQRLGESLRTVALTVAPRLLAGAARSEHRAGLVEAVDRVVRTIYTPPDEGAGATMVITQPVRLIRHDKDALERIALALAYEGSDSRGHAFGFVEGLRHATAGELESIVRAGMAGRGPNDPPPRAFEAAGVACELMLDFGSFRDLARHRMLTPMTQRVSCRLGFDTPTELGDVSDAFQDAMLSAHNAWMKLDATHPWQAEYVVPLGFRVRGLWTLNMRELVHVIELRSKKEHHPACRRIAQAMYRTTCAIYPWMKDLVRVDLAP